ncbi:MAG: hypothetical protein ACXVAX_04535 [Pseudobdellovibrio sp.]
MNELKPALEIISEAGLNVFASWPLEKLPEDLRAYLKTENQNFKSLVIFGHGGRRLWENLPENLDSAQNPVDHYSLKLVREFHDSLFPAEKLEILYPLTPHLVPLQRLGRFLNLARPSHLGLDLNVDFGAWFAYRVAFLTTAVLPEVKPGEWASPCETCVDKPCVSACPSGATRTMNFGLSECAHFRLSQASPCLSRCLARLACPYKAEHAYTEEQINYHMMRTAHLVKLATFTR